MKEIFPFYTIGDFINQPGNPTEFEILRFEDMEEPNVDDVHKHSFYEILWTEKGVSRQTIDYKEYEVRPNTLFFISPNQVHHFEEWKPLQGGTILFTEQFFLLNHYDKNKLLELSFLDNMYTDPCIRFDNKEFADLKQIIDLISKEQIHRQRNPVIVQSLLHVLLAMVQRKVDKTSGNSNSKNYIIKFKTFRLLLEKHFADNQTARFYAEAMNITQHHLNNVVKKITGKTATEMIRTRSILEAKRMLTFTDLTVTEVAASLHYFDSSYFSKVFHAEAGMSPLAFKKEMSENYLNK